MSDHEERVEHPEVSRARKAVGAEPEGVPNAIVSDLLDRYDAMKAERDAAVRRAEEAIASTIQRAVDQVEITGHMAGVDPKAVAMIVSNIRALGKGEG